MIKSQDDLNQPETHSTEVLLSTIEELERTKKQLEIALKTLEEVAEFMTCDEKDIQEVYPEFCADQCALDAVNKAFKQIKELDK